MKVRTQFKNMTVKEQALFSDYLDKKTDQIAGLLTHFPEDAVTLETRAEKFEKHDAFDVDMTLHMPSKTIKAKEASHAITKAIDLSKDRLVSQIKKTLDTRKHSSITRRSTEEVAVSEELIESFEVV